jgi:hypothetical protein
MGSDNYCLCRPEMDTAVDAHGSEDVSIDFVNILEGEF